MIKSITKIKEQIVEIEKRVLDTPSKENTALLIQVYKLLQNLLDNYYIVNKDFLKNNLIVTKEDAEDSEKYLFKCHLNTLVGLEHPKYDVDNSNDEQYQNLLEHVKDIFGLCLEADRIEEV